MRDTDDRDDTDTTIPDVRVRRRPALDRWLRDRGLDDGEAGRLFGCSRQTVWALRLPFGDPRRKEPSRALRARIVMATRGQVCPRSFLPTAADVLTGEAA